MPATLLLIKSLRYHCTIMLVYHGTHKADLFIINSKRSRYSFPALFATTNIALAKLYARYQVPAQMPGYLYEIDIAAKPTIYPYHGKPSFSREFRNLMYEFHRDKYKLVQLTDVLDYPVDSMKIKALSDIIVIFDLTLIRSVTLYQTVS